MSILREAADKTSRRCRGWDITSLGLVSIACKGKLMYVYGFKYGRALSGFSEFSYVFSGEIA